MITIHNTSQKSKPTFGPHTYEIKIHNEVIAVFSHLRQPSGLVRCLRDAADAVEELEKSETII